MVLARVRHLDRLGERRGGSVGVGKRMYAGGFCSLSCKSQTMVVLLLVNVILQNWPFHAHFE